MLKVQAQHSKSCRILARVAYSALMLDAPEATSKVYSNYKAFLLAKVLIKFMKNLKILISLYCVLVLTVSGVFNVSHSTETAHAAQIELVGALAPLANVNPEPQMNVDPEPTPVEPVPVLTAPPDWARCPEYWDLALLVGWRRKDMRTLDYVMHRESRCTPRVHNQQDPSSGSRGLTQINGYWHDMLIKKNIIEKGSDLYHPETNLRAALMIYRYQVSRVGWGWDPWAIEKF